MRSSIFGRCEQAVELQLRRLGGILETEPHRGVREPVRAAKNRLDLRAKGASRAFQLALDRRLGFPEQPSNAREREVLAVIEP